MYARSAVPGIFQCVGRVQDNITVMEHESFPDTFSGQDMFMQGAAVFVQDDSSDRRSAEGLLGVGKQCEGHITLLIAPDIAPVADGLSVIFQSAVDRIAFQIRFGQRRNEFIVFGCGSVPSVRQPPGADIRMMDKLRPGQIMIDCFVDITVF